ncbi:Hsp70 family protein [Nocardia shimofusensis]|uniref:Hsp70 family protein n=1 Tax=Nocardia shimofusensis TaxID=228596 RepID=UPI000AA09FDD|nr:Hsp70 family protein [Nocardia shimofusensis]
MSSVLGVSVGASTVRLVRPHAGNSAANIDPDAFDVQSIRVSPPQRAEELAAEAVGVALATTPEIGATAIAYRNEQQAHALRAAMARQQLTDYELIPETVAAVEYAQATGDIRGISSLVVYDLGSSGLTVSVVDAQTREVRHTERTSDISGDYLDSLIREQQIASGRIAHPQDEAGLAALDVLCREAKEQLSSNTAVALPSRQGLVLLTQENLESLIMLAIESSARMARDVIVRSDRPAHGVLAIGGSARIPLLGKVLERWMGVQVIVPESPETVVARGAALLARPVQVRPVAPRPAPARPVSVPADATAQQQNGRVGGFDDEMSPAWLSSTSGKRASKRDKLDASMPDWLAAATRNDRRPEVNGAVLTVSALVVVAAIGLGLGYGPQVLERDRSDDDLTSVPTTTPPRTTTLEPQIAVAPETTEVEESIVVAPPRDTSTPPPTTPGPNTFVVPGLPPIVIPTIPPEAFPFPAPPQR